MHVHPDITLVGTFRNDRGYVYYEGSPICAEDSTGGTTWNINAARVICRMLGFSRATEFYEDRCTLFGGCLKGVYFGKSGFKCTGSEFHIMDCPHDATVPSNCGTNGVTNNADRVGVECA